MRLAQLHPPRSVPDDQRFTVIAYAAIVPLLVCATVAATGVRAPQTIAVLLVVLVIVAAAATGLRSAGLTATVSGTLCFDYFLTEPTHSLAISGAADVQTALLLLVVGVAVTEIAQRHGTPTRTTAQAQARTAVAGSCALNLRRRRRDGLRVGRCPEQPVGRGSRRDRWSQPRRSRATIAHGAATPGTRQPAAVRALPSRRVPCPTD